MENKIITIYELMGFIKDGKPPKKIKYDGYIWKYCINDCNYYSKAKEEMLNNEYINILEFLDDKVEILPEENNEWEDIEELAEYIYTENYTKESIEYNRKVINQLIKNQKYLKEKLESKDEN